MAGQPLYAQVKLPDELRGRLTVPVPVAGRLLGLGRDSSYAAAIRGDIPSLRIGRRIVVPVPQLLRLLGVNTEEVA